MKRIIFASALSLLASFSISSATAQDLAGGVILPSTASRSVHATNDNYRTLDRTEVNTTAARDFAKKYGAAQDVKWVAGKNGQSVYFTYNGLHMRSTYDKAGKREYTLKYYGESAMSAPLRHLVKSNYYDYKIDLVTEVERKSATYFLVKMQNDKEHLTIKVIDGEIIPYEHVLKSK